jgi:hypothetical protein
MITITPISDKFILTCDEDERATIEKLLSKQSRKLERHIEEYLASRKLNIREQENMLIMKHMTEEERKKRLDEIGEENA